ncbi:MAG: PAS domain S-box protein [Methanosarcinaceae archaeon]|nr:PAS domain S-box protein [Methanosarcinaceae archaeon]
MSELKTTEIDFLALFNLVPSGLYMTTPGGKIIDVNPALVEMLGYPDRETLIKQEVTSGFVNKQDRQKWIEEMERSETAVVKEFQWKRFDGGFLWVRDSARAVRDKKGKVLYFVGAIEDITERKQAEEMLRESEEKYHVFFDNVNDLIQKVGPDGKILLVNNKWLETLEYSEEEVKDLRVTDILRKDQIAPVMKLFQGIAKGESINNFETIFVTKNGKEIYVEGNGNGIFEDGKFIAGIGIFRDISKRKYVEETLRSSEERLKILFEKAPDAYYLNDFKGNLIDGNRAAEKITGYKKEELLGKSFLKLKLLSLGQIAKAVKLLAKNISGKATGPDEFILQRKDGSQVPVEINTQPVKIGGKRVVLGLVRDITKQKLAEELLREYTENLEKIVGERTRELREVQEELMRKERLAILGKLAGGISHELRTPLGTIMNAVYFLNMAVENPEPEVKEMLEVIENEISISNRIITGMLDFARPKEAKKQEVDVNSLLQETLSRIHIPKNIEVERFIDEKLPQIISDQVQTGQIFVNIIQNGFQAMPDGGKLVVESKAAESDKVVISFLDTGIGISEENLKKLFEPLFSTKPFGTGLGLALVKMLIERNGGTILVESKVGEGSTFTVTFPASGET